MSCGIISPPELLHISLIYQTHIQTDVDSENEPQGFLLLILPLQAVGQYYNQREQETSWCFQNDKAEFENNGSILEKRVVWKLWACWTSFPAHLVEMDESLADLWRPGWQAGSDLFIWIRCVVWETSETCRAAGLESQVFLEMPDEASIQAVQKSLHFSRLHRHTNPPAGQNLFCHWNYLWRPLWSLATMSAWEQK